MPARAIPVFVVLPPRTLLLDVAGPVEVLRKANQVQDQVAFEVAFVGPWLALKSSIGLTLAEIAPLPQHLPDGALVVVSGSADPPAEGDPADEAAEAAIVAWLEDTIRPGIRLVTICSGAMLAARAGLLDGHACTTHFGLCAELAAAAPRARVLEDRLFVEDGERLTSAGVTAGIDLMLHLVHGLAGPAAAAAVARALVVYLRRAGSDPQLSPFLVGRNHIHPAVHRVQDLIAAEPAKGVDV